jgi:hypothetical protein
MINRFYIAYYCLMLPVFYIAFFLIKNRAEPSCIIIEFNTNITCFRYYKIYKTDL